jgi:hypothetical protein
MSPRPEKGVAILNFCFKIVARVFGKRIFHGAQGKESQMGKKMLCDSSPRSVFCSVTINIIEIKSVCC